MDRFGLFLRKIPAKKIVPAYRKANEAGITIPLAHLESHFIAGGDPSKIVDACILAMQKGVDANINTICAIELSGNDPVSVVNACIEPREYYIETFSPNLPDKIIGHCHDGTKVNAACNVKYQLPLNHIWGWTTEQLHLHLSAKIALSINTSDSFRELQLNKQQTEASLLRTATDLLPSTKKIELVYTKG